MTTRTIDAASAHGSRAQVSENEVEKRLLEKAKMDQHDNISNKAMAGHRTKKEEKYNL